MTRGGRRRVQRGVRYISCKYSILTGGSPGGDAGGTEAGLAGGHRTYHASTQKCCQAAFVLTPSLTYLDLFCAVYSAAKIAVRCMHGEHRAPPWETNGRGEKSIEFDFLVSCRPQYWAEERCPSPLSLRSTTSTTACISLLTQTWRTQVEFIACYKRKPIGSDLKLFLRICIT